MALQRCFHPVEDLCPRRSSMNKNNYQKYKKSTQTAFQFGETQLFIFVRAFISFIHCILSIIDIVRHQHIFYSDPWMAFQLFSVCDTVLQSNCDRILITLLFMEYVNEQLNSGIACNSTFV